VRIAQVCHRYSPNVGGVERHVQEIAERLARKHEVEVISADLAGGLPRREEIKGVKVTRFRSFSPGDAYFVAPQMASYIKTSRFDVVHAHNYHALPALFAALAKTEERLVFNPHYHGAGSSHLRDLLNKAYKNIGSIIFKKSDKIICDSNYERRLIKRDFRIDDDIEIVPSGVDLKRIRDAKPFNLEEKFILYLGRLDRYKNVQYAIRSMAYMPEDLHFYIGGRGEYLGDLKSLIDEMDLEGRVKLLGFVPEVDKYRWMKSCEVFVNLSGVEAFGITVLEAMAAGAPVVVSAEGGLMDFAEKFDGVVAVRPERISAEDLAAAIRSSIGKDINDDLDGYDWTTIVKKIENIYKKI